MSVWVVFEITETTVEGMFGDDHLEVSERLYDTVYGTQAEMEDIACVLNCMNPPEQGWQSEDGTRGYWPTEVVYCEAREIVPVPEDYTL